MSYVRRRRLAWDPVDVPDLAGYDVFVAKSDVPDFLAQVEARQWEVYERVPKSPDPALILDGDSGLEEGVYQFAVRTADVNGNLSDAVQSEAWQSVPLDLTAPPAPENLRIEVLED